MRTEFLSHDQVSRTFAKGRAPTVEPMPFTFRRHQAECDCGWLGPRRMLRGAAVVDTYQHAAMHLIPTDVSNPFVAELPVSSAR